MIEIFYLQVQTINIWKFKHLPQGRVCTHMMYRYQFWSWAHYADWPAIKSLPTSSNNKIIRSRLFKNYHINTSCFFHTSFIQVRKTFLATLLTIFLFRVERISKCSGKLIHHALPHIHEHPCYMVLVDQLIMHAIDKIFHTVFL